MNTKIVYVLTFSESNWYFEQALLSAYSARMHNPNAEITIVTDDESESLIRGWRNEIYKYVNKVIGINVPTNLNSMQKSRWLKTSLRNIIDGDYLFIDTDTIICRSLNDIDDIEGDICAVPDMHCTIIGSKSSYLIKKFKQAGYPVTEDFIYFNSGVMLVRDNELTRTFYQKWHDIWTSTDKKGVTIDQVALRIANVECGNVIRELPGIWNCQIDGYFVNYLYNAYIIHYYAYTNDWDDCMYYFKSRKVFEVIKENGGITPEIIDQLQHPYNAFSTNYKILSGEKLRIYNDYLPMMFLNGSPRRLKLLMWIARLLAI